MKPRTNKVIDIVLSEEKYYFPGETIRGSVIVRPKNTIKVNSIIIKFQGSILVSGKEKEVIPLFQERKSIAVNNGKSKILEAKQYKFPFEFVVPDDLPSVLDFGKNKMVKIHYKLSALLDRPMVPESLCPKQEYPVLLLEYIDVTRDNFTKPLLQQKEVFTVQNGKCHANVSVPRTGFTRGETIPVNIVVNTSRSVIQKDALVIELVRKVKISTPKNTIEDESVLKSNPFDLNIIGPYNFSQSITGQVLIPTTPPTIRYKEKVVKISYKIRATISFGNNFVVELPIVIGTWPRADIPIDDDDDEEIIQNMGQMMMSDESDGEERWVREQEEIQFKRQVRRSGSNGSLGSMSSWSTSDQRSSGPLTMTSSPTTSSLASPVSIDNRTLMLTPIQNKERTRVIDPLLRASFYESDEYVTQHEVPTRTLTFLSSNTVTPPPAVTQPPSYSSDSSSDSDFDEDDLLAIIERKRKKEKKKQKSMYDIPP